MKWDSPCFSYTASITKKELQNLVPFEEAINRERLSIEKIILVNPHLYVLNPQIERLVSLSDGIKLNDLNFTASYTGSGIWKLDGKALIMANAEYKSIFEGEIKTSSRYGDVSLEIIFTLYYNFPQDTVIDTIISNVYKKFN